ncbi:MAG: ATP-binding protein [Algicola sp.]|nr:ATP-binding protein [Algicola sp.]
MINNNVITIATQSAQLSSLQGNALQLEQELVWCEQVIDTRIKLYFEQESVHASVFDLKAPSVNDSQSCYGDFISRHNLDFVERLTLILALLPAVKPKILDIFLSQNEQTNKPYTEFGCLELDGSTYATGETLAFLLGGGDLAQRLKVQAHLQPYAKQKAKTGIHQLLYWQPNQNDPLLMKTPLQLAPEYLYLFTTAQPYRPDLSEDFPAQFVSADMSWDDLILPDNVMAQLQEIQSWIKHGDTLMHDWGLAKKIRPGYRALFHGPPGTGKTLTACLLGKTMGQDVYKVDLSMIMSKYIGETEKNLEKVFALAEDKSWILFFVENP